MNIQKPMFQLCSKWLKHLVRSHPKWNCFVSNHNKIMWATAKPFLLYESKNHHQLWSKMCFAAVIDVAKNVVIEMASNLFTVRIHTTARHCEKTGSSMSMYQSGAGTSGNVVKMTTNKRKSDTNTFSDKKPNVYFIAVLAFCCFESPKGPMKFYFRFILQNGTTLQSDRSLFLVFSSHFMKIQNFPMTSWPKR